MAGPRSTWRGAALNLEIEGLDVDVPDLTSERVGQFDVVLFLGVFYHLVDPIRALQNLVALTKEVAVIETHLALSELERPAMVFYPGTELNNDPSNWWGPNRQCVEAQPGRLPRQTGVEVSEDTPTRLLTAWACRRSSSETHRNRSEYSRRIDAVSPVHPPIDDELSRSAGSRALSIVARINRP